MTESEKIFAVAIVAIAVKKNVGVCGQCIYFLRKGMKTFCRKEYSCKDANDICCSNPFLIANKGGVS